jgi:hypothetical protein
MSSNQYLLSFLIVTLTVGVNLGQHLLVQLSISRNYLLITLIAVTTAGLIAHRELLFLVLVFGISVAINLPAEILTEYNVSRTILLATLLSVIILPTVVKLWA